MAEFINDPIHGAVSQGGFTREKGGNLRDHDGCKAGAGFTATEHYDGDFGIKASPGSTGPIGVATGGPGGMGSLGSKQPPMASKIAGSTASGAGPSGRAYQGPLRQR